MMISVNAFIHVEGIDSMQQMLTKHYFEDNPEYTFIVICKLAVVCRRGVYADNMVGEVYMSHERSLFIQ